MILIAIGANLPGPHGEPAKTTCEEAAKTLRHIPGLEFRALSSWYRSAAIPNADQPDFCNGVIRLEGEADPAELLAMLHDIEAHFGRARGAPNAPRTLDLDLIDLNGLVRATPPPILPHPRAHLRAFVLRPLLDVAPGWWHPTMHASVTTLLVDLPNQEIEPWPAA
jgi:2-amino-4-hydroxy-6-hydroxymethyldihydropteridine diphosphokinase